QELVTMGWLIQLEADQWALNRWGAHVRINLAWSRLDACPELAPPALVCGAESAPPESNNEPLTGGKNQEPATGGPPPVFNVGRTEEKTPQTAQLLRQEGPSPAAPPANPDLRRVVAEDLRDTGRLLVLYEQAVDRGLAKASEWGRLRFVAAAEHARIIGTK